MSAVDAASLALLLGLLATTLGGAVWVRGRLNRLWGMAWAGALLALFGMGMLLWSTQELLALAELSK